MKPFTTILAELRGGTVNEELAAAVVEITDLVRKTGRGGSVSLKLTIEPASEGDTERVTVTDDITIKPPKTARPATFFFADENNNLSRNDPQQRLFTVRTVDEKPVEARAVTDDEEGTDHE